MHRDARGRKQSPAVAMAFVILALAHEAWTRIFTPCELATELFVAQKVPWRLIADLICIADVATGLNSSYIEKPATNVTNYGIFRINHRHWCHNGYEEENICNITCDKLLGDDISSSVQCALTIYAEHGNRFEPWSDWKASCQGTDCDQRYLRGCQVIPGQMAPMVTTSQDERSQTVIGGAAGQSFLCEASGNPQPELSWRYNMTDFPELYSEADDGSSGLRLIFPKVEQRHQGHEFWCVAECIVGQAEAAFSFKVVEKGVAVPFYVVAGVVPLLGVAVAMLYKWRRKLTRTLAQAVPSPSEVKHFEQGNAQLRRQLTEDSYMSFENVDSQPYDRQFELDESRIVIDHSNVLGSGQFGLVLYGTDRESGQLVAVKTTKSREKGEVRALLSELKILIYLGEHPHIVNLIGANTARVRRGFVYLFVELCPLGDLEGYVRTRKDQFNCGGAGATSSGGDERYVSISALDPHSISDLLRWSTQIASAMEHLAEHRVIHGDLATRNILLQSRDCAKITDFGLSKQLLNKPNYIKAADALLHWRSMAPESLRDRSFSAESDVWSFGVTLWEIFSLGDAPYADAAGSATTAEFLALLEAGKRLQRPPQASEAVYDLMQRAWCLQPFDRPKVGELRRELELLWSQAAESRRRCC